MKQKCSCDTNSLVRTYCVIYDINLVIIFLCVSRTTTHTSHTFAPAAIKEHFRSIIKIFYLKERTLNKRESSALYLLLLLFLYPLVSKDEKIQGVKFKETIRKCDSTFSLISAKTMKEFERTESSIAYFALLII